MSEDITNGRSWANAYLDLQDALDAAGCCCNCTGCETCVDGVCVDDDSEYPTCKVCSGGNCLNAPVGTLCGNCKECDGEGACVYLCEGCESCVEGVCEDDDDNYPGACKVCTWSDCYDLCVATRKNNPILQAQGGFFTIGSQNE